MWTCGTCESSNAPDRPDCEVCGTARPALAKTPDPKPEIVHEPLRPPLAERIAKGLFAIALTAGAMYLLAWKLNAFSDYLHNSDVNGVSDFFDHLMGVALLLAGYLAAFAGFIAAPIFGVAVIRNFRADNATYWDPLKALAGFVFVTVAAIFKLIANLAKKL